jgi:hypothetical protein
VANEQPASSSDGRHADGVFYAEMPVMPRSGGGSQGSPRFGDGFAMPRSTSRRWPNADLGRVAPLRRFRARAGAPISTLTMKLHSDSKRADFYRLSRPRPL